MDKFDRLSDAEMIEAVKLAEASLTTGGQRTFLAKALLQTRTDLWLMHLRAVTAEKIARIYGAQIGDPTEPERVLKESGIER